MPISFCSRRCWLFLPNAAIDELGTAPNRFEKTAWIRYLASETFDGVGGESPKTTVAQSRNVTFRQTDTGP